MAQLLKEVVGHEEVINSWLRDKEANHLHHAQVLVGPPGVGKKLVARAFAQILLCEKNQSGCGECGSCKRVEAGAHESLFFVPEENGQIKVETAHHLREFLSLKKLSRARVIIIERADLFLPAAANVILKTLEEPPEDTYFFLIAPSAFHLLPTIRSRVITMRFGPLTPDEMKSKATGMGKFPDWALIASRGRFDRLEAFKDDELKADRIFQGELLKEIFFNSEWLLGDWRKGLPTKTAWVAMLEFWLSLLRDAMVVQNGNKKSIVNIDQSGLSQELSTASFQKLDQASKLILGFLAQTNIHRDPVLLLEELYLRLSEVEAHVV